MIGYYVHHMGLGHLQQARCIAAHSCDDVTGLSSLARPVDWVGDWVELPRDDADSRAVDPTAHGQLHWAPLGDDGLRTRMAAIADWVHRAGPTALVVDVSVEVTALARLMGIPVASMVLPGTRDDAAHRLGWSLADMLLAPWPRDLSTQLLGGAETWAAKMLHVGAFSRFDGRRRTAPGGDTRSVVVLRGCGGSSLRDQDLRDAEAATPAWRWTVLGGPAGRWVDDPWEILCSADVVVTHGGLNALAEVAAARRPAIVVPEPRPHDEQATTAAVLGSAGLVIAVTRWPAAHEWPALLAEAERSGSSWTRWSSGVGARRAADAIGSLAARDERACLPCASPS
ncbi:MAG: glycosyl transferase [Actinomycetota bacterium]|nr:glycosyl transferase [Actinomycetota bacterium]